MLTVQYRGRTVHDVLRMTVDEAQGFFSGATRLEEKLRLLHSIGLGYLRLGQPATTLSGGEAQRLKIAAELARGAARVVKEPVGRSSRTSGQRGRGPSGTGGQLYVLDEPTTGLHLDDVKKLLVVLNRLVDAGHTVVVVEHNLDVIKTADWIIDLGPEGGEEGGYLVAEGRPEQVAQVDASYTGRYLKSYLGTEGKIKN